MPIFFVVSSTCSQPQDNIGAQHLHVPYLQTEIPTTHSRLAHPGKMIYLRLAHSLPKAEKLISQHAHSLPSLQDFVALRLFGAFYVKFQGAQHAQNYFVPCPKILHTLPKPVQGPCTPCWQLNSGQIWRTRTVLYPACCEGQGRPHSDISFETVFTPYIWRVLGSCIHLLAHGHPQVSHHIRLPGHAASAPEDLSVQLLASALHRYLYYLT